VHFIELGTFILPFMPSEHLSPLSSTLLARGHLYGNFFIKKTWKETSLYFNKYEKLQQS
jgi:hypothetical protein